MKMLYDVYYKDPETLTSFIISIKPLSQLEATILSNTYRGVCVIVPADINDVKQH